MAAWGNILRRVQQHSELDSLSDSGLLQQFVQQRSASAFEALVRRHGTLVWRQCQRELMEPADAEDVLQATFLLLAQRAAQLRKPESVAGWLVGVARRLSRRLAMQQRKRRERLSQFSEQRQVATREKAQAGWWEDEKRFLSPEYQSVIDLCLIQGLSRDEAALQLKQTPAAVHGLLYRARLKLKKQLKEHGTAGSAVVMGTQACGAVIDRLAPMIASQALGMLQPGAASTAVSPVVLTLMAGRKPIGWIISSLLAGALLAGGAGWWALASGYHLARVQPVAVPESNVAAGIPLPAAVPEISPWRQTQQPQQQQQQPQQQAAQTENLPTQAPPPPRQSAEIPMPQQSGKSQQKGQGAPYVPPEIPVPLADRVPSASERDNLARNLVSTSGSLQAGMVPFLPRPVKQQFDGKTLLVSLILCEQEYRDCTGKAPKVEIPPHVQVMRDPSWDGSMFQIDWNKEAILVVTVLEPTNCVTLSPLDKCWIAPDKNGVAHLLLNYDGKPPEAEQLKYKNYPYVMLKVQRKDLKQVAVTVWRTGDKPDAVLTVPEK